MKNVNKIKYQGKQNNTVMVSCYWLLIIFFNLFYANSTLRAEPQTNQSLEAVRNTAKSFLEEMQEAADKHNIEVIVSHIDSRTRLNACQQPLQAFLAAGAKPTGKTTVGIACEAQSGWKIYVPAEVIVYRNVWVSKRHLNKGEIITKADLEEERLPDYRLRRLDVMAFSQIVGTSPKRNIRAGEPIFQDSVCLVCRGQKVQVSAKSNFLSINVEGIALVDAALGETAKIRNSRSKRIFDAIVTGKNQLSVALTPTSR